MKLIKSIILVFAVFAFAGISFFSCDMNGDGYGTLAIRLPGSVSSRSISDPIPANVLNTFKYEIVCTSDSGDVETREARAGGIINISLATGTWDIKVTVKDEFDFIIGSKEEQGVEIKAGATKIIQMQISVDILAGSTIEMVPIRSGNFMMGDAQGTANERPSRNVTLSSFRMSKYPITVRQYQFIMNEKVEDAGTGGRSAAGNINWYDAIAFCNKLSILQGLSPAYSINGSTNPDSWTILDILNPVLIVPGSTGYRLPTEAQWEYACRAGITTRWHFGDSSNQLVDYAWFGSNSTNSVGEKKPNGWGLYHMYWNVWEWCWDWYALYDAYETDNPQGPSNITGTRVQRGGGYSSQSSVIYSAYRGFSNPLIKSASFGFRVVRPGL